MRSITKHLIQGSLLSFACTSLLLASATPTMAAYIEGTSAADELHGTTEKDTIYGYGNDDVLYGNKGNDILNGGAGSDIIFGQAGADHLRGQGGADVLKGGRGKDILEGGAGNDRLNGGKGNDRIIGGSGTDILRGGAGKDEFVFTTDSGTANKVKDFSEGDILVLQYDPTVGAEGISYGNSPFGVLIWYGSTILYVKNWTLDTISTLDKWYEWEPVYK